MIKTLRLTIGIPPRVKIAEHFPGHPVHVSIHGRHISQQQGFDKVIVVVVLRKPIPHHVLEHDSNLFIGQYQLIICAPCPFHKGCFPYLQIPGGQQQAPYGVLFGGKLTVGYLFVYLQFKCASCQQVFKILLYAGTPLPEQLTHQSVGTGARPVCSHFLFIQKVDDGPGVINISSAPKCEPVIPVLNLLLIFRQTIFLQGCKHFFLGKAKRVRILFRGGCHHFQIVQIREHGFLTHPGNPGHKGPFHIRIGLKSRIEQTSGKCHQFIPISAHIGLLHGRVIFIQQNDHLFAIMPHQKVGQGVQ